MYISYYCDCIYTQSGDAGLSADEKMQLLTAEVAKLVLHTIINMFV